MKKQWKLTTELTTLYLVASESTLGGVHWEEQAVPYLKSLRETGGQAKVLSLACTQLEEYFSGRRREFDLPLAAEGTEFQKKVWNELAKIPYGKTFSYGEIAGKIRNQKAVRAVGTANGRNPLAIIVPCHRVIAADGGLGGFAGGLEIKRKLLELERSG